MPAAPDGTSTASAQLQVSWPDGQTPKLGLPVQVNLTLQEKQGVLIIPRSALHQAGTQTTVEVVSGTLRHLVPVQIGITTDSAVEITSGLTEGQMVLAGAT
jgi:multidrug efflux pump subunit AcrA (membrane-fusion protein)